MKTKALKLRTYHPPTNYKQIDLLEWASLQRNLKDSHIEDISVINTTSGEWHLDHVNKVYIHIPTNKPLEYKQRSRKGFYD